MSYEEMYGETPMSDLELEIAQQRIDDRERLEKLEKCVGKIKDLLKYPCKEEELQDLLSEISYEINLLD